MASKIISEEPYTPLKRFVRLLLVGVGAVIAVMVFNAWNNATHKAKSYAASTTEFECSIPTPARPAIDGQSVTGVVQITCSQSPKAIKVTVSLKYRGSTTGKWADAAAPVTYSTPPGTAPVFVYIYAPCGAGGAQWETVYTMDGTGKTGATFGYPATEGDIASFVVGQCQRQPAR